MADDELEEDIPAPFGPDDRARREILDIVRGQDAKLEIPSDAIDLGDGLRWRPDLADEGRVLHIELGEEIPKAFVRRFRAAVASGFRLLVATHAEVLTIETLELLQELEAIPLELTHGEDGVWRVAKWESVADWVAMANIALSPDELRRLVRQCLDVAEDENRTNIVRGTAYEQALCMVFSQVSWLKVVEHGFDNASEEIDIVMVITGAGEYGRMAGGPMAIATAKNEKKALGSATVKYLQGQMGNRRGRCKLGFACARGEVSRKAEIEILRSSQTDVLIVPIGGDQLAELLDAAERIDERLAELVIAATLA